MPVQISPALLEDCDALGDIQRRAFEPTAIDQLIFGGCTKEALIKGNGDRFRKAIQDPHQTVYKAFNTETGQLVGIALWGKPHPFDEEEKKKHDNETKEQKRERMRNMFPDGTDLDLAEFFDQFDFGVKDPHWHLKILCVDPNIHGGGAGSKLLHWGLHQADKDGVDTYLEASIPAVSLYERNGFHKWQKVGYGGPNNEMALQPMRRRPLRIQKATPEQVPQLAKLHRDAFLPTRWFQALWGQVEEQDFLEWMEKEIKEWMDRGEKDHVVVAVRGESDLVGYAHWQEVDHSTKLNGVNEPTQTKVAPQSYPPGTNVEVWKAFTRDMDQFVDSIEGKFWHLHILASTATKQKTGAGKALVLWGAKKAQKQGLPVHLEGGNEAMTFYERLGFKVCGKPVAGICGTFEDTPVRLDPIVVSKPTEKDLPRLAEIHRKAFLQTALNIPMFLKTTPEAYDGWNLRRMKNWMSPENREKTHFIRIARRSHDEDGLILAYGHWDINEGDGSSLDSEQDTAVWPEGTDEKVAKVWFEAMYEQGKKIKEKHLMLHQLGTDPAFERLGAARLILQQGIDELVKGQKLPMYLDATLEGVPVYESLGFKRWSEDVCPDGNKAAAVVPMKMEVPSA